MWFLEDDGKSLGCRACPSHRVASSLRVSESKPPSLIQTWVTASRTHPEPLPLWAPAKTLFPKEAPCPGHRVCPEGKGLLSNLGQVPTSIKNSRDPSRNRTKLSQSFTASGWQGTQPAAGKREAYVCRPNLVGCILSINLVSYTFIPARVPFCSLIYRNSPFTWPQSMNFDQNT